MTLEHYRLFVAEPARKSAGVFSYYLPPLAHEMESEFSVLFGGLNGSLRLAIEGYQFPAVTDDWWDANWLIVRGNVVLDGRSWGFRDACLTTFELDRLASWLDGLAGEKATAAACAFTEPNLEFRLVSNTMVRVVLSLEALPPGADPATQNAVIDVPVNSGLADVAAGLRQILKEFQVRSPGAGSSATLA